MEFTDKFVEDVYNKVYSNISMTSNYYTGLRKYLDSVPYKDIKDTTEQTAWKDADQDSRYMTLRKLLLTNKENVMKINFKPNRNQPTEVSQKDMEIGVLYKCIKSPNNHAADVGDILVVSGSEYINLTTQGYSRRGYLDDSGCRFVKLTDGVLTIDV